MVVRFFDIILSGSTGYTVSILVPIIVILAFTGEGKMFIAERVGKNTVKFNILKFATMLENSPNMDAGTIVFQK